MKAMAADIPSRYQRASDVLEAVLARAHAGAVARIKRPWRPGAGAHRAAAVGGSAATSRRASRRAKPAGRFCWNCRKALHARADICPFCARTPVASDLQAAMFRPCNNPFIMAFAGPAKSG